MRLEDLKTAQLLQLFTAMEKRQKFMRKLIELMAANRWPAHDQFYRDIWISERLLRDAVYRVQSEWRYRSDK
jgi:hypothetical protein